MKKALLAKLQAARVQKQSAVLVTDLTTGDQRLFTGQDQYGDLMLNPEVMTEIDRMRSDDRSRAIATGGDDDHRLFIHVYNPPKQLIIVGAVHIAQSLAPMAALAGYDVTVVDPRGTFATDQRFPGVALAEEWPDEALVKLAPDRRTAVVTLTHDPKLDDPALNAALASEAFYIGALGSRRTHGQRLERLREAGRSEEELTRIHGPVGLNIGSVSPAEIAVSILGQMTQTLHMPAPHMPTPEPAA
jgi:xanthine dehydrogenase accessory factor